MTASSLSPRPRRAWVSRSLSSVRTVMILLVALATAFPLGIIIHQGFQHEARALSYGRTLSERIASQVVFDQQLQLSNSEQLLNTFSYIPAIRRRDAVPTNALLSELVLKNPRFTNLLIADEKGDIWASALPMKAPINAADRRFFRNAMATGRFSSGEFTIGRVLSKPAFSFGYPIKDSWGRITDMAIVSFSLDKYDRFFQSKESATEASLALIDHKGTVLFERPSVDLIGKQDREDLFRRMTAGADEGSFEAVGLTGVRRLFTYRKLRLPGEPQPYMYVRTGISLSSLLERTRKDFLFGVGSTALGAILVLLSSVLLGKRFVLDKVAALKEATARISRGDLSCRVGETVSEGDLGELGSAFDDMTARLQEADTERRKAETARQQSEERFRLMVESSPLPTGIAGTDGTIEFLNPKFISTFGYDMDDLRSIEDWFEKAYPDPEYRRKVHRWWTGYLEKLGAGNFPSDMVEFDVVCKDGSVRHVELITSARNNELFAVFRDLTDRKRIEEEKERLQAQLQQAMKMEAVGRLAGGVAHDYNNLMTVVTGFSELLLQKIGPDSPMYEELTEIRRAGERAAQLTQQLLAFSRKQIIAPKVLTLDSLVAEMRSMLVHLIGENVTLQTRSGKEPGPVKIDPGQFNRVLVNLVVNARDAMPDGGRIVIETANVELDEEFCKVHSDGQPGRYVMLAVTDTGLGMEDTVKEHIFEPFFTTKPMGSGTGLGLATTYGVVKQSGGLIVVESAVGKGTTFRIYLPRVEENAPEAGIDDVPGGLPGGSGTILLVEDEDSVRSLSAKILEGLGYNVMQAPDGARAIELAAGHKEGVDLLMTDVVMPGMNGKELAMQVREIHPAIRLLFTSGYTEDIIVHHGVLQEGITFLGKPYTPASLAKKIREVLDAGV